MNYYPLNYGKYTMNNVAEPNKAKKLFDHLKMITSVQDPNYFNGLSEEDKKSWSNFMINRFLSMNTDWTELIASLLPLTQTLSPEQMYKLYIDVIPKGNYYLKYIKGKASDKYEEFLVELISKEYGVSNRQALEYIDILYSTREGRENIRYICQKYAVPKNNISKLKLKL
jgi:hypothetical protein